MDLHIWVLSGLRERFVIKSLWRKDDSYLAQRKDFRKRGEKKEKSMKEVRSLHWMALAGET